MKRIVVVLALAAALFGCAGEPEVQRVDVGATPEKALLAALTKVSANDAQRIAILNAYDGRNGQLVALDKSAKRLIAQWNKLERTAPDYLQQVDALAAQWAQVNGDEMKARAAYEHDLAANLSPAQWHQWQDFMRSIGEARRRAELLGEDGIGGSRQRY